MRDYAPLAFRSNRTYKQKCLCLKLAPAKQPLIRPVELHMGICDDARSKGIAAINAAVDPLIEDAARIIANMRAKNLDPTKFYDAKNDQTIDLVAYLADLNNLKNSKTDEVNKKVDDECQNTVDFLQTLMDTVVASLTDGLSLILPKHMSHIDVGEILAGKPFGGDNSAINQLRGGVLNALGIGENSDLYKPIVNPRKAIDDFLGNFGIHL